MLIHSMTGKTWGKTRNAGRGRKRRGFTLVELLVVILIIVILASIAIAVTKRAMRRSRMVTDMNNVRNLATITLSMAGDRGGLLPHLHSLENPSPFWFSMEARRMMEEHGMNRDGCYAPTKELRGGKPRYEWWDVTENSAAFHYVYFVDDSEGGEQLPWYGSAESVAKPNASNWRGDPAVLDDPKPFARSLADGGRVWYPILWTGLCYTDPGRGLVAAFMEDDQPMGIHVVYLDGRAEWIDVKKISRKYSGPSFSLYW